MPGSVSCTMYQYHYLYHVSIYFIFTVTGSLSLSPLYSWGKGGTETMNIIPRGTWLESGGAQLWTQAVRSQSPCTPPLLSPGPCLPGMTWWHPGQGFSNLRKHQSHLDGLVRQRLLEPTPRVLDSVGLGLGPVICISNNLLRDADVTGLGAALWVPLVT